jgi:hypothetical protein
MDGEERLGQINPRTLAMKLPRVRLTVRRMMVAVAVCALVIVAPFYLAQGMGKATVEFVNKTSVPIEEVIIGYPGGEIRSKNISLGGTVKGKVGASSIGPDGWFNIDVRISVSKAGKRALVHTPNTSIGPIQEEPHINYELFEDATGQVSFKSKLWFAGGSTPAYRRYLWDKLILLKLWR